ncbi:hypothetical protein DPEC_G00205390 [Dallia pectoralis]|uniref:Uncharacterized protein n=1 Tax=Dallia pectoralis TaxID=75939 RepID=A0ACC2G4J0_DALPE|nr:hypothetical protein DPEC_G00205390 [Dallia pectoralis]
MSLKEDNSSVDNLVRTVITNFLQPTKPSQPKTTKQCPPLIKKVEHTPQPLYGLSVLDLKEARKRVLQRLNSLTYMETVEVKKPGPPSRIPVLQKNATCNRKDGRDGKMEEKACVPPMLMPLGPIQRKRRGYERSDVVMDIYLHSLEPLKSVHGVNMAAKPPLPPIRATVPINDAEKVPLKPVRPEGSPRRLTSRRRVVKRHVPVQEDGSRNTVHHSPCLSPPEDDDDDASVVSDGSLRPTEDLLESSPSSLSEDMFIDQDRLLCSPPWPLS